MQKLLCLCNVFMLRFIYFVGTAEDDTSIPTDEKLPILIAFHRHIYDTDWHYSCKSEESFNLFELSHPFGILLCDLQILLNPTLGGTKEYKVLMDQFHHVAAAFLELEKGLVLLYAHMHFCCVLDFFLLTPSHVY